VTLTAVPAEGWVLAFWSGTDDDSLTDLENTVTMDRSKIVTVSFRLDKVNLTTDVSGGEGFIGPGGEYDYGTPVTVTATPASCFEVASWSGTDDDGSTAAVNTVTLTSDRTVMVEFSRSEYLLTARVAGDEGGTVSPQNGMWTCGETVILTAEPQNQEWRVASWSGTDDDSSTAKANSVTMTSNKSIFVQFTRKPIWDLSVVVTGGDGAVIKSPDRDSYIDGTVVDLFAQLPMGWEVTSWRGTDDDGSTDPQNQVTMDADKVVFISFGLMEYGLTSEVSCGEGAISPSGAFPYGTIVDLTAVPAEGWEVLSWAGSDNDESTDNANTVTMQTHETVTVCFTKIMHSLTTAVSGGDGTIAPESGTYEHGKIIELTASPADDWEVASWSGTDNDASTENTNEVTINGDKTVEVFFKKSDTDRDGVPDLSEYGPDPDNPDPEFDGNNDGKADSQQGNVASTYTHDGEHYVTLISDEGLVLKDVKNTPPGDTPEKVTLPLGLFHFKIEGIEPGGSATLTLLIPDGTIVDSYYKLGETPDNKTPHWYEFMSINDAPGAVITGNTIKLILQDGQKGDDDLTENETIIDAGGPASVIPEDKEAGVDTGGGGGGCFISETEIDNISTTGEYRPVFCLVAPFLLLVYMSFTYLTFCNLGSIKGGEKKS